jgi:hypothetical protein
LAKLSPLKLIKIVVGSFSLCLLLVFVGFEMFLENCPSKDLQFLGPNQLKDRPPVLNKLAKYEQENPAGPRVVLLGSSLAQCAATFCDFGRYGSPDLNKDFAGYSKFRYLDETMATISDLPAQASFKTVNLSNSGVMISENLLILREVLAKKNPPRAVILEIGPRDFIDNMTPEPNRSRLSQVLSHHQEPFSWSACRSLSQNLDIVAEKLSLFYSMRGELRDCLLKMACDNLGHPASVYQASIMAKLAPPPASDDMIGAEPSHPVKTGSGGAVKLGHVDDLVGSQALKEYSVNEYRGRYLPINTKKWPLEVSCLKQIIALCDLKKVPLIVVNMPLTERNLDILPASFRSQYENTIRVNCTPRKGSTNLVFLDLRQDKRFELNDFRDTVHMRSTGGKKLADLLAPIVVAKLSGQADKGSSSTNTKFASKPGDLH